MGRKPNFPLYIRCQEKSDRTVQKAELPRREPLLHAAVAGQGAGVRGLHLQSLRATCFTPEQMVAFKERTRLD